MHSIVMGIRQKKGNVHLNFGLPLTFDEIEMASKCDKNDRYQAIRHAVDKRVIAGYHLWKTNYIAYDQVWNTSKYSDLYDKEDVLTLSTDSTKSRKSWTGTSSETYSYASTRILSFQRSVSLPVNL